MRSKTTGPNPFRWLWIASLLVGAGALGWGVVRVGSAAAFGNPMAAKLLAPDDPKLHLQSASTEFLVSGGKVTPGTMRRALDALTRAPLSATPFLLASVPALLEKQEEKAELLLAEARRRNPRLAPARLLLLDRYLRTGRLSEAAVEMGALGDLIPGAAQVLIPELARLAQDPKTSGRLEQALRTNPVYREPLLEHLASSGGDSDLILRLAGGMPPSVGKEQPVWQARLIARLVDAGDIVRAYQLWRTFSAPNAPEKKQGVYDGSFRNLPGLPPFDWRFPETKAGIAEFGGEGELHVQFYGRDSAELAGQLLVLSPGRYRLIVDAKGEEPKHADGLFWSVRCWKSERELVRVPLAGLTYSGKRFDMEFSLTSSCPAQWLRLSGQAAEFSNPQNATISSIQLNAVR